MDDSIKNILESIENSSAKKALEALESPMQKAIEAIERSRSSIEQYHLPKLRVPEFKMPNIPTQKEINKYQSAEVLMRSLADSIRQWRHDLPSDQQPAILAILNGGIQINVERLAVESFHGIRIEGKIAGNPCMVLAHQATTQLLCYIEKVENEDQRKRIGFTFGGKEQQV